MTKKELCEDFAIKVYNQIDKYHRLFPKGIDQLIDINGTRIWINKIEKGGRRYLVHHSEVVNPIYRLIASDFNPRLILDIGANYGFISTIMHKCMPDAYIIAVEPNKKLIPYLKRNFQLNGINGNILNAMVGGENSTEHDFFISPRSSMDSRVVGKDKWKKQPVECTSIDVLLRENNDPVFIKIDTQGFEEFILQGGQNFLSSHNNWIIKMEFCPVLLEHHSTNTRKFLSWLIDKYNVAEIADIPFKSKSLSSVFECRLYHNDVDDFIKYIRMQRENEIGWGDLFVQPKSV
jgi:FkbM family methyltransferase